MWKAPREGKSTILSILDLRERNYRLAVVNGWLVWLGDAFFNPNIVLAGFAAKLGAPGALIGLLPALLQAGGMVPQAFLAPWVARLPRKIVLYRKVAALRLSGLVLMALSAFLFGQNPSLLLLGFLLGLLLNALFTGVSSLPFWEVVAKTTPQGRRAHLFSARNLVGGLLAFLAGFLVRLLLALPLPFPLPYALLFALGALSYGVGWYLFGLTEEPEEAPKEARLDFKAPLRRPAFRRYLGVRLLLALAGLAEPFYAAYAVRVLGQGEELGLYLALYALAFTLSNLLWARMAERGSKGVLKAGAFLALLAPLLALLLPPGLFGLVFLLQGAYLAALGLSTTTLLLNLAPPEERSAAIGLANTLAGLFAFSPVLGGYLADWLGFPALFLLAALLYALTLLLGRELPEEG
ncbi:Predicted arabinose efflux permease, MFS family [Thermus arciformis]|uniref:Predicted arabinose efflux permease, MFS family n=1 Tax=Thermus arciformis TaxID=482827 RepID=A0A1G7K2S6_9DEIN|nr:MFS transporter [Thermus arciformis]SDF31390.1 Predicted arabinose efflux permease, MFS family [Thermus arciformis]